MNRLEEALAADLATRLMGYRPDSQHLGCGCKATRTEWQDTNRRPFRRLVWAKFATCAKHFPLIEHEYFVINRRSISGLEPSPNSVAVISREQMPPIVRPLTLEGDEPCPTR